LGGKCTVIIWCSQLVRPHSGLPARRARTLLAGWIARPRTCAPTHTPSFLLPPTCLRVSSVRLWRLHMRTHAYLYAQPYACALCECMCICVCLCVFLYVHVFCTCYFVCACVWRAYSHVSVCVCVCLNVSLWYISTSNMHAC
jgi:hypothetical protein